MKVNKTSNYSQFKKIRGNRLVNRTYVNNLITSITDTNLLEYTPILVNKQMEVIDGQHRLEAAKKLGIDVYYIEIGEGDLNMVQLLNTNIHNWSLLNFLDSYILLGNNHYKILKEYIDTYKLPVGISVNLLSGFKADSGAGKYGKEKGIALFKTGAFKVITLEKAKFIGDKLLEITPFTEGGAWKHRSFVDALQIVYEKVKPSIFLGSVKRIGIKIPRKAKLRDYLIFFEDIYNFRKSTGRQKFY